MKAGALLEDVRTQEARFRVESLLCEGKHYQIALGKDTHLEEKQVCLKAIDYSAELLHDSSYVQGRRQALQDELKFLTLPSHLLPEPLDIVHYSGSPAGGEEPVLVYEYQHGDTLHALVTQRAPQGMSPERALAIWRELVRFCQEIHGHGYIFRDFDPRHLIIGFDDVIQVVGCGNAVARGEKMNVYKMHTNPCYTAPEIRKEISGKVVKPACDFYSLGCLLSFMLTGIEPRPLAEAPLEVDAYDKLRQELPIGYKLLIARCMQPLAQKRFTTAQELLAFCTPETLPSPQSEGFGLIELPAPWEGPEGMDNRALRSRISPGPLVSQKDKQDQGDGAKPVVPEQAVVPAETTLPAKPESSSKKYLVVAFLLTLFLFLALVVSAVLAVFVF